MSCNDMSLVEICRKDLRISMTRFWEEKTSWNLSLKLCYDCVQWQGLVLKVLSLRVLLPKFIIGGWDFKKLMKKIITFTLYRVRTCVAECVRCVQLRAEPAHSSISPQRPLTAARSAALGFANAAWEEDCPPKSGRHELLRNDRWRPPLCRTLFSVKSTLYSPTCLP
jgi:hypothetical protein